MGLSRLIYASRVGREVRLQDAEAIAETSSARNAGLSITGFLLYTPQFFLQALEGEPTAVEATFQRIARDPRHSEVQVLTHEPIQSRSFADWHMGFAMHKQLSSEPAEGFRAPAVLRLLQDTARQQQPALAT